MHNIVVLLSLGALALVAGSLFKTARSIVMLRDHSTIEWTQLKSLLSSRHLIVTHLTDFVPTMREANVNPRQVAIRCREAESALQSIGASSPRASQFVEFAGCEDRFLDQLDALLRRIDAEERLRLQPPVSACLRGLEECGRKIEEATTTYNTAAITYSTCLEKTSAALVARVFRLRLDEFAVLDLSRPSSDSVGVGGDSPSTQRR